MSVRRLTRLGVATGALILMVDQLSKAWILYGIELPLRGRIDILPVLSLTMVWNRGVTFGLLNSTGWSSQLLLAGVALLVVGALGVWLHRAESAVTAVALGAVAGGAIGNVIDRMRYGAVVDFIHFHIGNWSWYVFNVADAAIVCGVAALVLDGLRGRRKDGRLAGA